MSGNRSFIPTLQDNVRRWSDPHQGALTLLSIPQVWRYCFQCQDENPCSCSLRLFSSLFPTHTVRYTFTVMLCYHLFTVYLSTFNLGLLSHVAMSCLSAAFSWPTWTPTFCWEDEVRARSHFLWTANQTKMFWEEFFIFQQEKTHRFLHLYYMLRNAGMRGWVRKLTLEFQNQFLFPDLGFPLARSLGLKGVIHGAHLGGFKQKWNCM